MLRCELESHVSCPDGEIRVRAFLLPVWLGPASQLPNSALGFEVMEETLKDALVVGIVCLLPWLSKDMQAG